MLKILKLRKGQSVAVFPLSVKYGDTHTAYGMRCHISVDSAPIELSEPFQATFEDYDGASIFLRTENYYCIQVMVADLKDIIGMR